jgi:RNA polymerase sigma factor (TIGR02999 family)
VNQSPSQPVTELLVRWRAGDSDALESLVPLVYKELRDIARRHLMRERPGHTLQSAALVHEAYLRMLDQRPFDSENRAHFLAVASRLMRQVLVDHARTHGAAKRGADRKVDLDISLVLPQVRHADVIALDDALKDLSKLDEQQGRIVELRFFGGPRDRGNRCRAERLCVHHQTRMERRESLAHARNEEGDLWRRRSSGRRLRTLSAPHSIAILRNAARS